ncbi:hypothetical protein RJT34_32690 [Clitoria ternatea]|uniref:Uncharacterized protein n=1 Tax=Clitoria ternatea TaxID=43366 RepID=A0AAN9I4U1_CLITE
MRPPTSYPLSTIAYLSEHSLQGGFLGNVPAPTFFRLTAPEYVDEAVWREMEKGRIRRELEKEQIRRELEKEVRIEMELERRMRMGIPIHIPAAPDGVSSGGRMALSSILPVPSVLD